MDIYVSVIDKNRHLTVDGDVSVLADCVAILLDDIRRNRAQRTAQAAQQNAADDENTRAAQPDKSTDGGGA